MQVLIVNAFISEAVGDAALLSVMINQVRDAFPDAEVSVSTLDDPGTHPSFDGCPNIGSMRRYGSDESIPRWRRAARKLLVAAMPTATKLLDLSGSLSRFLPAEVARELRAIRAADLIVSVGGGYLNGGPGVSGDLSVANMLAPLAVATNWDKPVFCGPQSYGPFATKRQFAMVRRVLSAAETVVLRERKSQQILAALAVHPRNLVVSTDAAFAFPPGAEFDWRAELSIPAGLPLVGITARQWYGAETQRRFEAELSAFADQLQARGYGVVLIPQVISDLVGEDDRDVNRRIAEHCVQTAAIYQVTAFDHERAKALYRELDYLVGMRFHSVIFALTSDVPAIAIEYHHKASGIMADLGLSEWVASADTVLEGGLYPLFERLAEARDYYLHRQRRGVEELRSRTGEVPGLLRAAVAEHAA